MGPSVPGLGYSLYLFAICMILYVTKDSIYKLPLFVTFSVQKRAVSHAAGYYYVSDSRC